MNRTQYLKKLRRSLRWGFSGEEIADIMADYRGFFAAGLAEGKTEAEVCTGLGSPRDAAADLISQLPGKRPLTAKAMARIALSALLVAAAVACTVAVVNGGSIVGGSIASAAIFSAALWAMLGGTVNRLPPTPAGARGGRKWALPLGHGLLLCLCGAAQLLLWGLPRADAAALGRIAGLINTALILAGITALLAAGYALYGYYKKTPMYFSLAVHASGAAAYLLAIYSVLLGLDNPASLARAVNLTLIVYGVSAVLAAAWTLLIKRIMGRGAARA